MSVDIAIGALTKTIESSEPWPRPRCPDCNSGHIRFGEPALTESRASERGHPGWEPEWIHGTFSLPGECDNPSCGQTVQAVGDYRVDWTGRGSEPYSHFFE